MILGLVKKNTYQDSVNLMLLSSKLSSMDGVRKVSIMMGTPANKDIFRNTGMYSDEFEKANPNDICISVDTDSNEMLEIVNGELEAFISDLSTKSGGVQLKKAKSLKGALSKIESPNLALVSIPGEYVYEEGKRLLDAGMNLFIFSDNMPYEEEKSLKEKAREKKLIVMGPDCGTGIISGVPLAFANVVSKGNVGIVGASGTGIQEVTSAVSRLGGGISHAIGIGGRDLSEEVGGISAELALDMLGQDTETEIIVFISKPPAPEVRNRIINKIREIGKKTVAIFLGETDLKDEDGIHYASTLEDAANLAYYLSRKEGSQKGKLVEIREKLDRIKSNPQKRNIHGYYGGGTLAGESKIILKEYLSVEGNKVIDYGDDQYTQGRPHPMIDPGTRVDAIKSLKDKENVAIVLFDNVIGYGSSEDMAGALSPAIAEVIGNKRENGEEIVFIASVCGTEEDIQDYAEQVRLLEEAGVTVTDTNAQAAKLAKDAMAYLEGIESSGNNSDSLVGKELRIVNVGLESFAKTLYDQKVDVVQYNWSPIAGGDKELQAMLKKLENI